MSPESLENYLFLPGPKNSPEGTLYSLQACGSFATDAVVLLPYFNPQIKSNKPQYYKIIKRALHIAATDKKDTANSLILKACTSKKEYIKKVISLKEHIQRGNIYEINFCIQFYADNVHLNPLHLFNRLHAISHAPYALLLKTGDRFIISASPELFLKKEGNELFSKPIKGTIKRGQTTEEDEKLKLELHNNIKERTENVMAVDVARNDLSIVAKRGSVSVNKLYNIESFETVHQMVSTVKCQLKENIAFEEIIDATFPMASMTGAPKKRAMTLIDEFEDAQRESYSGAMGIIDERGDFELSVLIRSIFYDQKSKRVSISVGSAITYLSDPESEYEECLLKARAMLSALNAKIG